MGRSHISILCQHQVVQFWTFKKTFEVKKSCLFFGKYKNIQHNMHNYIYIYITFIIGQIFNQYIIGVVTNSRKKFFMVQKIYCLKKLEKKSSIKLLGMWTYKSSKSLVNTPTMLEILM